MRSAFKIAILFIVLFLLTTAGLFYKDSIFNLYSDIEKNFQKFERTDLENIIGNIQRQILAPAPLNIGGRETNVILSKDKIIAHTNIQRFNNGQLPPLIENAKLSVAAEAKAKDMFLNQYFEHMSPSGTDAGQLIKNHGYDYIIVGENLILGNFASEEVLVQHWMDSPGHRANILNERFSDIGVAVMKGVYNGQTAWIGVQEFGLPLSACNQPSISLKNQIDSNKAELDKISLQIESKKDEIENTNPRSKRYNELVDEYNQLVNAYNSLAKETKNFISQYNQQVNVFNQCVAG